MPATPEQLLAVRLTGSGRAVLDALWSAAIPETAGEGWCAARVRDLAQRTAFCARQVRRAIDELRGVGLVDRTARAIAGRMVEGWRLFRVPLRRERTRKPSATVAAVRSSVTAREKTAAPLTKRDDLVTMAAFARRGDSEVALAERLRKARAKCSEGEWHKVKVHRRIAAMKREIGISPDAKMPAGDVVFRWKAVNERD